MLEPGGAAIIFQGDSRCMGDVESGSVDLVVTSPPYWAIKDYGVTGQIGHGQSLHDYLRDLARVWGECFRAIREGGRLCVNIGDQFARASLYGRYRVIPLHAEIICQCAALGFDYMGSIVWRKKTTMNPSGGATVMGSYPYPPNGVVEIDFEYLLLFKKPGASTKTDRERKKGAAMRLDEWKSWFSGHWDVAGARKEGHEATFPEEIPRRLIRMFSFPGDTVLDPFLGTGTTALVARELGRSAIGYEINPEFVHMTERRLRESLLSSQVEVRVAANRPGSVDPDAKALAWTPSIPDLSPAQGGEASRTPPLRTVKAVENDCCIVLDTGERVVLDGVRILDTAGALAYLRGRVLRKKVFLRDASVVSDSIIRARVVLKNRISVNAHLVKAGLAEASPGGKA